MDLDTNEDNLIEENVNSEEKLNSKDDNLNLEEKSLNSAKNLNIKEADNLSFEKMNVNFKESLNSKEENMSFEEKNLYSEGNLDAKDNSFSSEETKLNTEEKFSNCKSEDGTLSISEENTLNIEENKLQLEALSLLKEAMKENSNIIIEISPEDEDAINEITKIENQNDEYLELMDVKTCTILAKNEEEEEIYSAPMTKKKKRVTNNNTKKVIEKGPPPILAQPKSTMIDGIPDDVLIFTCPANKNDPLGTFLCTYCSLEAGCIFCLKSHFESIHLSLGLIQYKCNQLTYLKEYTEICYQCNLVCERRIDMLLHRKVHFVTCDVCDMSFDSALYLSNHCKSKHDKFEVIISCDLCEEWFKQLKDLSNHYNDHHSMILCIVCFKRFSNQQELNLHHGTHKITLTDTVEILPFACSKCNEAFADITALSTHLAETHPSLRKKRNINNSAKVMETKQINPPSKKKKYYIRKTQPVEKSVQRRYFRAGIIDDKVGSKWYPNTKGNRRLTRNSLKTQFNS